MRRSHPFQPADLEELHTELFSRAERVVPMRDIYKGDDGPKVIGLRHDVDDNIGSLDTALRMAEWEFERGYSATYFLLHDSHYWGEEMLSWVAQFEELGHEVGIHVNAIAEGLRQRQDPHRVLAKAIAQLRNAGVRVVGSVAHGDAACYADGDNTVVQFVNDEIFIECPRPTIGKPDRLITHGHVVYPLQPVSRSVYGLEYDANWLSRSDYLSDSGGKWSQRFEDVCERFGFGQLHVLVHPDWWSEAFAPVEVAA